MAVFEDQVLTTAIAQGGDSGSAVLNENNQVIGLLFAGSDAIAIVNKIANVIEGLGLDNG
jgi:V8-like Glu-specific endopeptidase